MKKVLTIVLSLIALFLVFVAHELYYMSNPLQVIEIESGSIGSYTIKATKGEILENQSYQSFSPMPKPKECPKNWIDVSSMTETQRSCLLNSFQWQVGYPEFRALCNTKKVDINVTLYFSGDVLEKLLIECWKPK